MSKTARYVIFAVLAVVVAGAAIVSQVLTNDDDPTKVAGVLGPTPGPDATSEDHITAKRQYLEQIALEDPDKAGAALVSLNGFVSAEQINDLADGYRIKVLFVRFPGAEAEVLGLRGSVRNTLKERAEELKEILDAEVASLQQQADAKTGADKDALQRVVDERKAHAAATTADCACVYGFAVEGSTLRDLSLLAKKPEVRLVEVPDPVTADLGGWELIPILPATSATPLPAPS